MKAWLSISAFAVALSMHPAHAGNIAVNTETRTTPLVVGAGDWYATAPGTVTLNAGGSIVITNASFQTILAQLSNGTSTININSGGSMDFSGASGNGKGLYLGNASSTATGIINVNGGFLGGAPLTDIVFGRSSARGEVNISTGSILFGAAPTFESGFINFTSDYGDSASLRVIGQNEAYFQGLFTAGTLRFQGGNTGTFSDHFQVNNDTLIVAVPEPSAACLLGAGLTALLIRRRHRSHAGLGLLH